MKRIFGIHISIPAILFAVLIVLLIFSFAGNVFQYHQKQITFPYLDVSVNTVDQADRLINFTSLRSDLTSYISTQSADTGMYFEYIPTGVSIGINDKKPFWYASLLKVPLVMSVYDKIERKNLSLTDTRTITSDMINKNYGDLWEKGAGTTITIRDAIEKSQVDSDDTAYNLLKSTVSLEEFYHVFDYLDIPIDEEASEAAVTAKNYTSVLRSLLFSSFLTPNSSNDILNMLTHATFRNGIRAAIPETVPVAHKFGIRSDSNYLSDCGIVYIPERPYFLCIMTKGSSIGEDITITQEVSNKIYRYITNINR